MNATIISIGDEILNGMVVNTNAAFIAEKLNSIGIYILRIVTVGDDEKEILNTFKEYYKRTDIIIVTGGLGPTHDDVTRNAVCKFFDVELVSSEEACKNVQSYMQQRNRGWTPAAEDQTFIPEGAVIIPNKFGTAVGELFEKDERFFIVMPGVPYEMKSMMNDSVIPFFQTKKIGNVILHKTLMTTGIPESEIAKRLGSLEEIIDGEKLAFLPSPMGVRLRITVSGEEKTKCEAKLLSIEKRIRDRIGKYIYSIDDEEIEAVVGKILTEKKLKLAIAESCTGGMIANKFTNISGSSNYIQLAVVTYSNKSKIDLLNVPKDLIDKHGAVSKEVAEAMASGVRSIAGSDIGISTTGIAGPTGGTKEKPIGLVWIGFSNNEETAAQKFQFGEGRIQVKERASQAAIDLLRRKLLNIE